MATRVLNLWGFEGTVTGRAYAFFGVTAFLCKFLLDKTIAYSLFHRPWSFWSYWLPLGPSARVGALAPTDRHFVGLLVALALPFIWLGVAMTVKRLRDVGQPVWLVALFFVPVVNLLFFVLLCVLPSRARAVEREAAPWPNTRTLDRWIPRDRFGSALVSLAIALVIGLACALLGIAVLGAYGWGLFVALPFCLGLFTVLVHSYYQERSYWECVYVSVLPVGMLGLGLMVFAMEGAICILMAAPIAIGLSALGGSLGYGIQLNHWGRQRASTMFSIVLLFTPSFMGMERIAAPQPSTFAVRTAIEVSAPPEKVWQEVVAFAEIPPPTEMLFRAGIAYPMRAEISGHGAGAVRRCVFSTGAFIEPITVWDEPHLLRFSVAENPAPLAEWTPYGHVEPRHLHGYFVSHQGQFLLTELPGGRTRLEGTTWYQHTMWPETYWHVWSDYIIHKIHLRVLEHIKRLSEATNQAEAERDSERTR